MREALDQRRNSFPFDLSYIRRERTPFEVAYCVLSIWSLKDCHPRNQQEPSNHSSREARRAAFFEGSLWKTCAVKPLRISVWTEPK